tara:strand:+ start:655 stop:1086 length:432 start_codon:yes stop_codon:yes gene_type:complete
MIYIVASNFYKELSNDLIDGATASLASSKIASSFGIKVVEVPGAFEIPGTVKKILDNKEPSLIITLGVIVKGETNHFEQISEFVFDSISKLTMSSGVPISFGVISALDYKQAQERALISKRNKGAEVASAGLKMLKLYEQYKK